MTLYAIGDIHGHLDKLERALALITADGGPGAPVVFIGDYTDRGPDSRAVLQLLIDGLASGENWTCLKGNHDRMFEWFLGDEPRHDPHLPVGLYWLHDRLGGATTLASYGVEAKEDRRLYAVHAEARAAVPASHIDFLKGLQITHETDDLFFAHAGIRPGVPLKEQIENDLIWIRAEFIKDTRPHPKLVIHGHTPADTVEHGGNRINLDGGAAYGRPLVPVAFEGTNAFALTDAGRVPLTPPGSRA